MSFLVQKKVYKRAPKGIFELYNGVIIHNLKLCFTGSVRVEVVLMPKKPIDQMPSF